MLSFICSDPIEEICQWYHAMRIIDVKACYILEMQYMLPVTFFEYF